MPVFPWFCVPATPLPYIRRQQRGAATWGKVTVINQGAISLGVCEGQLVGREAKGKCTMREKIANEFRNYIPPHTHYTLKAS